MLYTKRMLYCVNRLYLCGYSYYITGKNVLNEIIQYTQTIKYGNHDSGRYCYIINTRETVKFEIYTHNFNI